MTPIWVRSAPSVTSILRSGPSRSTRFWSSVRPPRRRGRRLGDGGGRRLALGAGADAAPATAPAPGRRRLVGGGVGGRGRAGGYVGGSALAARPAGRAALWPFRGAGGRLLGPGGCGLCGRL